MRRSLLLALATAGWLMSWPAAAATLCVSPGGGGGCFATIQAAVDAAATDDTIDVAAGVYTENVVIGVGKRLTIQGAGAGASVVDGAGAGNVFQLLGPGTQVTLSGLTVQNGYDYGIVLYQRARAILTAVEVTGNAGFGAVVEFGSSRLTITASVIRDNNSHGVVAYARSRLRLMGSTVSGNAYNGIVGHEDYSPGGVPAPFVLIEDSTISGNGTAAIPGGDLGISGGSLRILRSTITENAGVGLHGPFIRGVKPRMSATILSNNGGGDCGEPIRSKGYNFIGTACAATRLGAAAATDVIGDDPQLGPLQDNGGPTPTQAPSPGSPVLEVVGMPCEEPDQRGVSRLPSPCDVGAHEEP